MTIEEKRSKLVDLQSKATAINGKTDKSKEDLANLDVMLNEMDGLRTELIEDEKRAARMAGLNEYLNKPVGSVGTPAPAAPTGHKEWRNMGEWFIETRAMSMGVATTGGVVIPEQFTSTILSMAGEGAIVRPRATVIPAGDPPDAKITIPVFNQFGANGIYGGMSMVWIDEAGTKADNTPEFTSIELEPKELGGSTIVTDKLIRNAPAMSTWLANMYRTLVTGKIEYTFLRGNGVGQPMGVLTAAGRKTVTRNTASSVLYADVRSMLAALPADSWGNAVWVANQSVLPQLINLVDGAGNTLFMVGDITKKVPASLFGLPIVFTGKTPVLGSTGDLMLIDFSYYLIKEGSGPYIASSEHVYFTTNRTVVKCFTMIDGQPWVKTPLTLEDGSTTVSPYVVLV